MSVGIEVPLQDADTLFDTVMNGVTEAVAVHEDHELVEDNVIDEVSDERRVSDCVGDKVSLCESLHALLLVELLLAVLEGTQVNDLVTELELDAEFVELTVALTVCPAEATFVHVAVNEGVAVLELVMLHDASFEPEMDLVGVTEGVPDPVALRLCEGDTLLDSLQDEVADGVTVHEHEDVCVCVSPEVGEGKVDAVWLWVALGVRLLVQLLLALPDSDEVSDAVRRGEHESDGVELRLRLEVPRSVAMLLLVIVQEAVGGIDTEFVRDSDSDSRSGRVREEESVQDCAGDRLQVTETLGVKFCDCDVDAVAVWVDLDPENETVEEQVSDGRTVLEREMLRV